MIAYCVESGELKILAFADSVGEALDLFVATWKGSGKSLGLIIEIISDDQSKRAYITEDTLKEREIGYWRKVQ